MTAKPKIILDPHFRTVSEIFTNSDLARLHEIADVVWGRDEPMPQDAFEQALPEATAIVCAKWRYGDVLPQATHCRAIIEVSGVLPQDVDYAYCFQNNIRVLSVAPSFAPQVAEMTLAMTLASCRNVVQADRAFRAGTEQYVHAGNQGAFLLYGKRVSIIGYGNLARSLRPLIEPFGCELTVYDPWLSDSYLQREGLQPVSIDELLSKSRVIFVLAAPTKENEAFLSREKLEMIRSDAIFVLMSRAHVVDFDALTDLLLKGRFRAAIDVFPYEPMPADHPIRQADHAVLTAHLAGSVPAGLHQIGQDVLEDLEAILKGLPPRRLQRAEPEFALRYETNTIKQGKAKE